MSNYNSLKTTIDANIKQNGRQEIKGQILNSVLNQMVTTLGIGYQFMGVATIDTNPGSPDAKVFYIANGKGTYTNFGGLEVTEDEVVVLYWDSSWHKEATGIASNEKLTELEKEVIYDVTANNSGATFASLSALLSDENLSILIPVSVRCGGMSIRFLQSSDNKYVQYRLMADSWSTTESDWQGADDEPTAGSDNLVKSGGVKKELQLNYLKDSDLLQITELTFAADSVRPEVSYSFTKDHKYKVAFDFNGFAQGDDNYLQYIGFYNNGGKGNLYNKSEFNPFVENTIVFTALNDETRILFAFTSSFIISSDKIIKAYVSEIDIATTDDLDEKVDKIEGKQLSTNDFTDEYKENMGVYQTYSFKSEANGYSISQYYNIPCTEFKLTVNQIVGSTTKYIIYLIKNDNTSSIYLSECQFGRDYKVYADVSLYKQIRIYSTSGTAQYQQNETDYKTILETYVGVKQAESKIEIYDGVSVTRKFEVTQGVSLNRAYIRMDVSMKKGVPFRFILKSEGISNATLFYLTAPTSNPTNDWNKSIKYGTIYPNRPYYIIPDADWYDMALFASPSVVTKTETISMSVKSFGSFSQANRLTGLKGIAFGDSITQLPNTGDTRGLGICEYFELFTGAKLYRAAIGGTKLSRRSASLSTSVTDAESASDCYQICSLIEQMVTGDLTKLPDAFSYLSDTFTNDVTLQVLQSINMNDIDFITIFGGTNDCSARIPLGSQSDTDPTTIYGAINFIVKQIHTHYPRIKVFIFSPCPRWYSKDGAPDWSDNSYWSDNDNHNLPDYAEAILTAGKHNHIPVCDLYYGLGWNEYNFHEFCAANDGTHPRFGFDVIAEKQASFIKSNL